MKAYVCVFCLGKLTKLSDTKEPNTCSMKMNSIVARAYCDAKIHSSEISKAIQKQKNPLTHRRFIDNNNANECERKSKPFSVRMRIECIICGNLKNFVWKLK